MRPELSVDPQGLRSPFSLHFLSLALLCRPDCLLYVRCVPFPGPFAEHAKCAAATAEAECCQRSSVLALALESGR